MPQFKVENLYRTTITSSSGIAASGDVNFTVTTPPINPNGYIVISPDSTTLREIMYYHNVSGNTIYVRAENRISPKAHSKNEVVQINDVAEIFNTYSDMISTCFYIEKTGGLTVKVWGGTVYYNGTPQTVADTNLTLTDNTTNYIKYDFATNTISGDTVNSGNIKATIVVTAGVIVSIVYNVSKESYSIAGGGDMYKSDNLSGLANNATARTNIGLDTTANQTDSTNKRFMTDAQETKLDAISGTNTGDNAANTNSLLVHTTGNETIAGVKTFSDEVKINYGKGIFNDGYTIPALKTEWSFPDTGGSDSTRITPAGSAVTSNMVYSGAVRNGSKGDFYVEGNTTITGTVGASNLSGTNTGDEPNASLTVEGVVELATTAEINTGTDTTRAMPVDQFVASNRNVRYFDIYAIEKATDNAVGNNIAGAFECPFTGTITEIGAYVETAGVTGASIWDVNKNGTTIMTTNKLSIDTAEVSTRTAATAPALTTTAIAVGDLITIDCDSLSTTKPQGLHVRIGIRLT